MTDAELVRQAQGGRMAAYEELVRRWSGRVLAVCHARVGAAQMAEDLAQETWLRGFRSLATLESPQKFGPWLCGIARNVCLDWRKSRQNSQVSFTALGPRHLAETLAGKARRCDPAIDQADQLRELLSHVESLPEEYREVLMLYYYEEVTYRDVAELLGVSTATVNARLTKARALLRARVSSSLR